MSFSADPDDEENELLNWWRYLDQDDEYIDEVTEDTRGAVERWT